MRGAVLFLAVALAAGCSSSKPDDAAPVVETHVEPAVLGHFTTRNHRVTWLVSDEGARFTVRTDAYELLASELTAAEVEARFPELRDIVRAAVAGEADELLDPSSSCGTGAILDASAPADLY